MCREQGVPTDKPWKKLGKQQRKLLLYGTGAGRVQVKYRNRYGRQRSYQAKYEGACECLRKDREVLQAFYDFPAEHWKHLRTTNPIESTFATIRLRHRRTKGNGTRKTSLAMMFKLAQAAQKRWRRLNGHEQLDLLLQGRIFVNGVLQDAAWFALSEPKKWEYL